MIQMAFFSTASFLRMWGCTWKIPEPDGWREAVCLPAVRNAGGRRLWLLSDSGNWKDAVHLNTTVSICDMGILLTDAKYFGNPAQSDKPLPEQYFFGAIAGKGKCQANIYLQKNATV